MTDRECSFATIALLPQGGTRNLAAAPLAGHVPFDFYVGEVEMRAGVYLVERASPSNMMLLRNEDPSSPRVLVPAIAGRLALDGARILFYFFSQRYFLAQVLTAGRALPLCA